MVVPTMVACSEMALRLGRADADLWSAWLEALAAIPGDPYGAELRRFNETTALLVHGVPLAYYNRVLMRDAPDVEVTDDIAPFYRERLTPCRIDVNPYAANSDLLDALDSADFRPAAFQSNLLYLCRVDGIPASGAMLYTNHGVATLTGAATSPAFRGRRWQRALLQARLNDTVRSGCDLVVSRCGVGSPSQRNLERAGLQTGYTKVIWEQRGLPSDERRVRRRRVVRRPRSAPSVIGPQVAEPAQLPAAVG